MSQGSLNQKIRFLGQKVCSVARVHTDKHESEYRGQPLRVSGFFPSTYYHQGSVQGLFTILFTYMRKGTNLWHYYHIQYLWWFAAQLFVYLSDIWKLCHHTQISCQFWQHTDMTLWHMGQLSAHYPGQHHSLDHIFYLKKCDIKNTWTNHRPTLTFLIIVPTRALRSANCNFCGARFQLQTIWLP